MREVTRRYIVRSTLLDFLSCCISLPILARGAVKANGTSGKATLNWDAFIEHVERAAHSQHESEWSSSHYVQRIASYAKRLNLTDSVLAKATDSYHNVHPRAPEFSELFKTADVQVSLISFERGELINHHNHPDMTGVITCAVGQLWVSNYDLMECRANSACLLRQVSDEVLWPGQVSTLTDQSKNVHVVRAQALTQVIDIFTPPYNEDRVGRTRWYQLWGRPTGPQHNIYEASYRTQQIG
jgi:hypothetical protein